MPRLMRAASACLVLVLLAGCGASLIYPRLDTVVAFYFQDLVSLDDAQSDKLSQTLSANLAWHRQSELGKYADFLRDLAGSLEQGGDGPEWLRASRQTEQYWRDIFVQAAPGYIAVARTLTDAQVAELLRNLEQKDEDTWREFSRRTPQERRARREKSVTRAIERFTGPLTTEQHALVRDYAAAARSFMPEWRENRRIWRDALAAALADRSSGARFEQRMTQLIARPDDLWTPQYRVAVDGSRAALVGLLGDLDVTLTGKQRGRASRELLALADEIQGLARGRS
jgi:IS1 family transposase